MQWSYSILSSVACPALQYFSAFFKKKVNEKCVYSFSLQRLSETFFIIRVIERDMIKIHIGLHVKYPFFLLDFNET